MAFWGKAFVFNGTPCEEFELMLYDVGGEDQSGGDFASTVSVVEETVNRRWKPYFYGVKRGKKLTFEMVFGVDQDRLDYDRYLDRYEINTIATWLTGHDKYMWLEIEQDDMAYIRYKCIITQLSIVTYGKVPWALKATVECDGPFGYLYPQELTYTITNSGQFMVYNESAFNGYYKPEIEITTSGGGTVSIVNLSDDINRAFTFTNVPADVTKINVDNEHCVITNNQNINLYPYFNNQFLRLKPGYNSLSVTGSCTIKLKCEFPVNFGG